MADDYNSLLSPGVWKGKCGKPEILENEDAILSKSVELAKMIREAKHVVVFTGAGISTSSGIRDFRGPQGIWTLEEKLEAEKKKPTGTETTIAIDNKRFEEAVPSQTHMALLKLQEENFVKFLISQNVDGLHMFSGFPRDKMVELHGNVFMQFCEKVI